MKFAFILIFTFFISHDYKEIFGEDYNLALQFVKQNKQQIVTISEQNNADIEIIVSVMFPELIRYSILRDFFETSVLELLYVEKGSEYVDFSIGRLQMKPSFIEKMENYIKINKKLSEKYARIYNYPNQSINKIRQERISRLQSFKWQLRYMNCFYTIVSEKFKEIQWENKSDKIHFFAAAYNHGFNSTEKEIRKWAEVKLFPYGKNFIFEQHSYCDVSVDFYKKYCISILTMN